MILDDSGYVYCDDLQCANASNIEYVNNCHLSKKIKCDGKVSDYYDSGFITRQNQTADGNQGSGNGICENKTIIYDPYCEGKTNHFWNILTRPIPNKNNL